jgi:putative PIN family toxin of toxin-antitoxin system
MCKVVIDTNVFVSSFFGGVPREILDMWKHGEIKICLSQPIVEEYIRVLKRMGLQSGKELEELTALFAGGFNSIFAADTPVLKIVKDPDDNKFLECAVALGCKVIVSGDRHLLELSRYFDVSILTPRQYIELR